MLLILCCNVSTSLFLLRCGSISSYKLCVVVQNVILYQINTFKVCSNTYLIFLSGEITAQFLQPLSQKRMSQAFVKEEEEQWLHEIQPTVHALIVYLTHQNNGIRVYEKGNEHNATYSRTVYHMSNGLSYMLNKDGKWKIIL